MDFLVLALLLAASAQAAPGDDPRALACDTKAIADISRHRHGAMPTTPEALHNAEKKLDQLANDAQAAVSEAPKTGLTVEAQGELTRLSALERRKARMAAAAAAPQDDFAAVTKALGALPEMHSFKADDGTNLVYSIFPGAPEGKKPIVICQGKGESAFRYIDFTNDLADRGYGPIIILDHRNQGFSEGIVNGAVHVEKFDTYAKDFIKFMDGPVKEELASRGITEQPALIAHSMGGAIANLALRERPDLAHSVAYISPMFGIQMGDLFGRVNNKPVEYATGVARFFGMGEKIIGHDKPLGFSSGLRSLDRSYEMERAMKIFTPRQTIAWLNEALKADDRIRDLVEAPHLRTLFVDGNRDKLIRTDAVENYARGVPNSTYVEMSAGHAIHQEAVETRRKMVELIDHYLQGKQLESAAPDARIRYQVKVQPELAPIRRPASEEPGGRTRFRKEFYVSDLEMESKHSVSAVAGLPEGAKAKEFEVKLASEFGLSLDESVALARNFHDALPLDGSIGFFGNGDRAELTKYPLNLPAAFKWGLAKLTPGKVTADDLYTLRSRAEKAIAVSDQGKLRIQDRPAALKRKNPSFTLDKPVSPEVRQRMAAYGIEAQDLPDGHQKIVYTRDPTAADLERVAANVNAVVNAGIFSPEYVAAYTHQELALFHGFNEGNDRTGGLAAQILFQKISGKAVVFPPEFHDELNFSAMDLATKLAAAEKKPVNELVQAPLATSMEFPPRVLDGVGAPPGRLAPPPLPGEVTLRVYETTTKKEKLKVADLPNSVTHVSTPLYCGRPAETNAVVEKELKRLFQYGHPDRGGASYDLTVHVHQQGTVRATPTGFFSTSTDFRAAAVYTGGNGDMPAGMVLVIDPRGAPGISLPDLNTYLEKRGRKDLMLRPLVVDEEHEFAITALDPRQIRGAWVRRAPEGYDPKKGRVTVSDWKFKEYIANPNYDPAWNEARAAGGAPVLPEAGPVRTTDGIGEGSRVAVSASDTPYQAEVRTAADGSREAWVKLPPSAEHPDGVAQRVGTVKTLPAGTPLVHWSTREEIEKLEREKSIPSETLERYVRNPLPNDNYGGGEYLSTDAVDSISFGDHVIATRTKAPLQYVVSDAMKKEEQVGITQALRNAGFQGVGVKLMPNWVNVTDARFLEDFSTDVKPIVLEQLKRKPFDEGVRDLLTWDQRFPITADTLPQDLLPPVRKLLLHQALEPREEEDLYRAVKGSQEYLFFLLGRDAEKRAKQADPSYVPKTFFSVDQARDEFRRLGGTVKNPPAQTPLWNAVREFFDKKAATVPGGVPFETLLDGKNIPLYHLPAQLTLTGWEPFSLSEVSKGNIKAFESKLGSLSSDESRLARDLEALPLTVSTRRASSDDAKIQSSGGILPRTELLSRGDTTPPWPQPGGSHTPRTEEDLYGASDWSFATVSAASWKGSPNYGDALYDVADEYWRTNSWATPTSGLKIYEHYRGIARGPESMSGIKNSADFAGAKLAFRSEVTAPSDYSRRIALNTISFLRGQPENVRKEFYAAKAQDLPGLLNKYQLGFLEAKMPGIPVAELKRVSDTAVAALPTKVRTTDGAGLGARVAVFRGDFSPPNEAEVRTLRDMVSRMRLEQVILLPGLDTGKSAAEQRALAAVAFAGIPEARLPSPKLDAELRGKTYGDSVELLARRNPGSSLLSVGDASSLKDSSFGNARAPNVRYGVVTVANDPNTSLAGDFVRAKNLSDKVSWIRADAPIDSKAIRAALARGDKPEGLAPGVENFLRDHRAPAVTRAELAAAKDPSSLKALAGKLEASRAELEAGDHPPASTLIANRNAAYEVAARLDAQGLKDEAMKARDAARYHEAVRLETEPRPTARAPASAREHLSLSKMLSEQTERAEIPIRKFGADLANKFPPEYEGTLVKSMEGKKLVVLGAGSNLYNGFLSVKYRLSYLMGVKDQAEKGFFLFDPGFLEKDANGALRVKAEAKAAHPNATILTSMKELPDDSIVIGLTPNSVHADNVAELAGNPKVKGLYLEKPIATSEAELARIQKATDSTLTPAYFGDHYLHAGGGLLSSMGVPVPGKSALEITYDPTGALAGALTRGEPALKKVSAIEGVNFQEGRSLGERPNLRLASKGGGVGPDLQVHLTNVTHALGYDFAGVDRVEEMVYTASEPGKGEFVPVATARLTSPDAAADYRLISGKTNSGATYRIESAQFKPKAENTLTLTGDGGRKLKVDFESGTTELFEKDGTKIGEMRQRADAYLLTMHDAVTALASGEPEAFQLPQQAASVREAILPAAETRDALAPSLREISQPVWNVTSDRGLHGWRDILDEDERVAAQERAVRNNSQLSRTATFGASGKGFTNTNTGEVRNQAQQNLLDALAKEREWAKTPIESPAALRKQLEEMNLTVTKGLNPIEPSTGAIGKPGEIRNFTLTREARKGQQVADLDRRFDALAAELYGKLKEGLSLEETADVAAWAYMHLAEETKPFFDGNGRTGHSLVDYIFLREGYPPPTYFGQNVIDPVTMKHVSGPHDEALKSQAALKAYLGTSVKETIRQALAAKPVPPATETIALAKNGVILDHELGRGQQGAALLGMLKGEMVVAKTALNYGALGENRREAEIMKLFQSNDYLRPYAPKLRAGDPDGYWLLKDYVHGPTAEELSASGMSSHQRQRFRELFDVVNRFERNQGLHLDFRPRNVVWSAKDDRFLIVDLGPKYSRLPELDSFDTYAKNFNLDGISASPANTDFKPGQFLSKSQRTQLERTRPALAAAFEYREAAADQLAAARHDYFAGKKSLAELDKLNAQYGQFAGKVNGENEGARRLGYLRQEEDYLARRLEQASADGDEGRAATLKTARVEVSARLADETTQRREALATSGKLASIARRDHVAAITSETALARYADELGGRSLKEVTASEKETELFRALRERDAVAEAKELPKSEVFISNGARVETNYPLPEHLYTWVSDTTLRSNSPMGSETHAWKAAANKGSGALINWRPFFPNPKDHGVTFAWKNAVGGMAAVQGLEEYGDAVVRLKLKPGTKALHVTDFGTKEFVIPPGLKAKDYQVLFRENERLGIREWIVLDHDAIEQAVADPKALEPELRGELKRMQSLGKDYPLADLHSSKQFNPAGNVDNFAFAEKKVEAFLARPRNSIPKPLLLPEGGEEASEWAKIKVDPPPLAPLEAKLEKELAHASPAETAEAKLVAKRAETGPPAPKAPSPEETEKLTAKVKAETDVSRAPASIAQETFAAKAERELGAIPGLSGEQRKQLTAALSNAAAGNHDAEADLTHLTRLAANPDNFETYRLAYVHATEALATHHDWKLAWEEGVKLMLKESGYSDAEILKIVDDKSGLKFYQQTARCLM